MRTSRLVVAVGSFAACGGGEQPGAAIDAAPDVVAESAGGAAGVDAHPESGDAGSWKGYCAGAGLHTTCGPYFDAVQKLPKGACTAGTAECNVETWPACPGCPGACGPLDVWLCACDGGAWSCGKAAGGLGTCPPPSFCAGETAEAGPDADGGG